MTDPTDHFTFFKPQNHPLHDASELHYIHRSSDVQAVKTCERAGQVVAVSEEEEKSRKMSGNSRRRRRGPLAYAAAVAAFAR